MINIESIKRYTQMLSHEYNASYGCRWPTVSREIDKIQVGCVIES